MGNETFEQYGESVFTEISRKATEYDAVDLGQGFPGYLPPSGLRERLREVPDEVTNHQYAPASGTVSLKRELSDFYENLYGLQYDPDTEITVTSGATEGIHAALLGLVNPGDEVIVFEPVYDQYVPVARRAGADVTVLPLREDTFGIPVDTLAERLTDRTELIVLNNPHNPTGKVFDPGELRDLVGLADRHDVTLLSDEVYEHLWFDGADFRPLSTIDGARSRTLRLGSAGKTFDATGWKVGWATGPPDLTESLRLAHQFTTYCTATPVQVALAEYLAEIDPEEYFSGLRASYGQRRKLLIDGLKPTPFEVIAGGGTYFVVSRFEGEPVSTDRELVDWMIEELGVAAIPMSAFYRGASPPEPMLRFAVCKEETTIEEAVDRIRSYFDR